MLNYLSLPDHYFDIGVMLKYENLMIKYKLMFLFLYNYYFYNENLLSS